MCPRMSTDELSILSGSEYLSYCNSHGLSLDRELMRVDGEAIHKMAIVDYLISNKDRHGENWGMYLQRVVYGDITLLSIV